MSNINRVLILIVVLTTSVVCRAVTVDWDKVALEESNTYIVPLGDGSYMQETYYFARGPAPMWFIASNLYQQNGEPYEGIGSGISPGWTQDLAVDFTSAWVEAQIGDVVNREYIEKANSYFFRTIIYGYDGFDRGGSTINEGETLYLAWACATEVSPYDATFGWMALTMDDVGRLKILTSAWDRDGDPIMVGIVPTPEPSSVFLLFFGTSLLALRRRRENGKMVTT
jgi:hypothetical protein